MQLCCEFSILLTINKNCIVGQHSFIYVEQKVLRGGGGGVHTFCKAYFPCTLLSTLQWFKLLKQHFLVFYWVFCSIFATNLLFQAIFHIHAFFLHFRCRTPQKRVPSHITSMTRQRTRMGDNSWLTSRRQRPHDGTSFLPQVMDTAAAGLQSPGRL